MAFHRKSSKPYFSGVFCHRTRWNTGAWAPTPKNTTLACTEGLFGPAALWRATLWRCDFLTQLGFFPGGCWQNNLKCGAEHKVLTEDELQGLFWACDSLKRDSLTLRFSDATGFLSWGLPTKQSKISPIQTRWISVVWEADLSEQILRILGFSSNFCHQTRRKPGVLEFEEDIFQRDSCGSLVFLAKSDRHGNRTSPILGCVGALSWERALHDASHYQRAIHDMPKRFFLGPKKSLRFFHLRQKIAIAIAEKSRHMVHSASNPFRSIFCHFQSVSIVFQWASVNLISFNQFDLVRNAGQPEGGENNT